MDDDKYPVDSDRRRFVKGVVGGSTLTAVGVTGTTAVTSLTSSTGAGGGGTSFYGVKNTDGPAPRGMPMIPLTIEEDGSGNEVLKGRWPSNYDKRKQVAYENIGGIRYESSWFQYCGVQTYPGAEPKADQDNTFRYADSSKYGWMSEVSAGEPVKVSDFSDYEDWSNEYSDPGRGKPAVATWRSKGVPSEETMPVEIIRSPIIEEMANSGESEWVTEATERGFMAHLNKCTHFCCVPGYATSGYENAEGKIYCQCHQSIYDPFSIVRRSFVALPRPQE